MQYDTGVLYILLMAGSVLGQEFHHGVSLSLLLDDIKSLVYGIYMVIDCQAGCLGKVVIG
jgi:hypothetical protein